MDEGDAIVILDPVAADGGLPGFGMSNPYPRVFEHLACRNLSRNKIKSISLGLWTNYIMNIEIGRRNAQCVRKFEERKTTPRWVFDTNS